MGYKMKGFPKTDGTAGKKTIVSEDTSIIKKEKLKWNKKKSSTSKKERKNYSLAMYDNDKGVNRGDTLFVNQNNTKVRQTTAGRNSSDYYIEGGQNLKLKETKDSKTRKGETPRSYDITGAKR